MLSDIINSIRTLPDFQKVAEELQAGQCQKNCLLVPRAVRLPIAAALHQTLQVPIFLITDRSDHALTLADELALWTPRSERLIFPEPNPLFYEDLPWGVTTRRDRLLVLTQLAARQIPNAPRPETPPIILAPVRATMTRTLPRREFIKNSHSIYAGQQVQIDHLTEQWVRIGYEPVHIVTEAGQFARRGGILDIWPIASENPIRIEFFGDEIETLREFNPSSQRTIQPLPRVLITPAREFIIKDRGKYEPGEEISEFHIPLIYKSQASILDYLPKNSLVLIDDKEAFQHQITHIEEAALRFRRTYIEEGFLDDDFPIPFITWDQIQDTLPIGRTVDLGPVSARDSDNGSMLSDPISRLFSPNPRFGGKLKPLLDHLKTLVDNRTRIFIVSRQSSRLKELWQDRIIPGMTNQPKFIQGSLTEGWDLKHPNENNVNILTDGEIFGWRRPQPRKRFRPVAESPEAEYANLSKGDWVVHIDHGVGQYIGLVRRVIDQVEREYICIEYAEGDQLFVPIHQADRLTRYVGPTSRPPTPTRLGAAEWSVIKSRVSEAVKEMAGDLLDLYVQRNVVQGHAFSEDTPWQKELEASFPYIETDDQRVAIDEVKRDMESQRPMDRLLCGDVGFGKTEVALRAAFKAVMDNKQVAILVPTTVLAQQHYHTFLDRLSAFPVEVEMLSRFRSPQQQKDIVKRLFHKKVDIIIGTHRLLSSDVEFQDLGLLIIDEEQRFGVTHKEKMKQMRTEVDVLTMTATPIPRTLYMTLTGIRDISTINTPPEERLPIITHVGPYDPKIIRRAIIRELERGGQVFFVHNRVTTILSMRDHIRKLIPEARVDVGHGQMDEKELSKRMRAFANAEFDVLLSTTIIESGLDIPNANTLIVDRADTFGLAQLYQLRGRVGRGAHRAYAYFFKHRKKKASPEGLERLETLAENTQLGAGFSIAMRDLEIRGAGDILGTRQHGHIAAVGFHLYTKLLSNAVRELRKQRGMKVAESKISEILYPSMVTVDLPFDTHIPLSYIEDRKVRLGLYRRMAEIDALEQVDYLVEELQDRFGELPEPVSNLLYQIRLKILAEQAGITSVNVEKSQVILKFPEELGPPKQVFDPRVRIGKTAYWVTIDNTADEWKAFLYNLLAGLIEDS